MPDTDGTAYRVIAGDFATSNAAQPLCVSYRAAAGRRSTLRIAGDDAVRRAGGVGQDIDALLRIGAKFFGERIGAGDVETVLTCTA